MTFSNKKRKRTSSAIAVSIQWSTLSSLYHPLLSFSKHFAKTRKKKPKCGQLSGRTENRQCQNHLSASQFWSKTVNVNPSLEIYWHRHSFVLLTGFFQYMHSKAYESKRPLRLRRRGMSWLMDVGMQGEYKCWPLIPASLGRHRTFPFMTGSLQWFFCCLERLLTEPHRLSCGTGH